MTSFSGNLVRIIGVGNEFRSDDGVGVRVARMLDHHLAPRIEVTEASGEGAALMEAWKGADSVILIDAARSGAEPGTIHEFDAREQPLPNNFFHYSTHAFSVAEAIEMARALRRLPDSLIVYGIEGRNFEAGQELSPEVEAAAKELSERLFENASTK